MADSLLKEASVENVGFWSPGGLCLDDGDVILFSVIG